MVISSGELTGELLPKSFPQVSEHRSNSGNGLQSSPDFADLLRHYAREKDLSSGKNLHSQLRETGLDRRTLLGNLLVQMYSKCGELELAREAFDRILEWNDYSWTIVTSAYVKAGHHRQAVELYHRMCLEGMDPDEFVFASVMNACSGRRELLEQGRMIHQRILATGYDRDLVLQTAVLNMYGKCGCLDEAREMFDHLGKKRNSVSWNAMLSAYSQFGCYKEALDLFKRMNLEGEKPDLVSFATVLAVCSSAREFCEGRKIHSIVRGTGIQADVILQNTLVSMYASSGRIGDARSIFDEMENKSVVSWTVMVSAYVQHELDEEALELYLEMSVKPEAATVSTVLAACSRLEALDEGREIHSKFLTEKKTRITSRESILLVENALVNFYAKCGCADEAEEIFHAMEFRDVVSWNTMLAGLLQAGRGWEALSYYRKMVLDGTQPVTATFCSVLGACSSVRSLRDGQALHSRIVDTGFGPVPALENALVNFYAKCRAMDQARRLFSKMAKRELATWNAMILSFAEEESSKNEAMHLYHEMNLHGVEPNKFTLTSVLGACSSLDQGKALHQRITASGVDSDPTVATCLLTMYVTLGDENLELAKNFFDKLPAKEVFSWTVMIAACIERGFTDEALQLFRKMDVPPDNVVFTTVLGACSSLEATKLVQAKMLSPSSSPPDVVASTELLNALAKCGALDDARAVFDGIRGKNVLSWTAMIVGYAQHARGDGALELFREMELDGIQADEITFTSILHACSHRGLVRVGREYFRSMVEDHAIAPSAEHYNVVMDMLARAGRVGEAEEVAKVFPAIKHVALMTLVSSSQVHGVDSSVVARKRLLLQGDGSCEKDTASSYIALSNSFKSL
ncbi:pentatricopeptide repeat-containing protein At5g27110 [Selaginella moellendorffii]|nr:pentatricopeptide repeat-containing protein At5g27110 [Selaginella moellendorffii]|eukprot:XP_024533886.1 pentatricopeptide repeat-containing protein At5g27110 [Selaginella moellendorffii]